MHGETKLNYASIMTKAESHLPSEEDNIKEFVINDKIKCQNLE